MSDTIYRADAIEAVAEDLASALNVSKDEIRELAEHALLVLPSADAETAGDMGEVSDGYHTFNQLYHQRAVLFATIVKQNKEKAWKSWKHEDGKFCFDSNKEWFIVGVDTPEGSYTYHYEKKYWNMFDCVELEYGKFWDGHTEEDVTRLLLLPLTEVVHKPDYSYEADMVRRLKEAQSAEAVQGEWIDTEITCNPYPPIFCVKCSICGYCIGRETFLENTFNYCPSCGAKMKGGAE